MAKPETLNANGGGEVHWCSHLKVADPGYFYKGPYGVEMELCNDCVSQFDIRLGRKTTARNSDVPPGFDWQPLRLRDRT